MKTISGHLTATEKKHIKAILDMGLMAGKINRKFYHISKENEIFTVAISEMDRGLIPVAGSELRMSTNTHRFTL